jgi:transposase
MRAYADDLRQKLLHAVDTRQGSLSTLARLFDVSPSWIKNVLRRRRQSGNSHALGHGGGPSPTFSPALLAWLRLAIEHDPDATEDQLCLRLQQERGVAVSQSTLSRAVTKLKLPRKKRVCTPANATPRTG